MRRAISNNLALLKCISRDTKQRFTALFLLVVFSVSVVMPSASAIAAQQDYAAIDDPATWDYPVAMEPVVAEAKAAVDAFPSQSGGNLSNVGKGSPPGGEVLQGVAWQPQTTPRELTGKRTATSSVSVNADGSVTERHFMTPKHFKKEGKWEVIDTKLVEDKNAGDSGNVFGEALGQVQSWFSSTTNFMVTENDWSARFSPSDFGKGMVRIKKGNDQVGFVPINAKKVAPVVTTDKGGKQTVHYYDLWPGVNLEYTVDSAALKENIVIKDKNAAHQVSFRLLGADLEKRVEKYKVGSEELSVEGHVLKGVFNDEFAIAPPNLILNTFGMVTENGVFGQTYENGVITISVDKPYLQSLPDNAFPAVIDPTTNVNFGTRYGGGNYMSFKSDGYICPWNICNLYAGSLYDTNNVLRWWRGAFHVPYGQFANSSNILINATLHLQQRSNESFWTGDWDMHNYQVGHATCLNNFNCVDGIWHSGNAAGSGDINVTNLYQSRINAGDFGAWLMVMGEDGTNHSYKNLDPGMNGNGTDGTYVSFTYGGPPSAPSIGVPSANQVFVDPQPSFKVSAVGNPNGSTPLQYEILVSTAKDAPGGTGALISSGFMSATQWTIPDGILQDGSTYFVQARSYDPITNSTSGWGAPVPFRIDMRTGKDKTQTYDTLGPVDVDLATGNVATNATSHTSAALGGSLGIGLDYNSPLRSRNGLVGEYWNNTTMSGSPLVTRVDQNVDFTWDLGSPSSGTIPNDNFSARWSGWFVAPTTGDYYFGGNNDDSMTVTVNGQAMYTHAGCWPGPCYGVNTIHLTAGQVVPIVVTQIEYGGYATARVFVKGPVDEQVLPQAWLQTGVRPVANQKGLIGSYFGKFDGTNTFSAGNPLLMQRTDTFLNFDWGTGSPMPNGPDGFLVRWTGYITVPTSGTYNFGVKSDDGAKIMLGTNDTVVYNEWVDRGATESYGSGYAMTANTPTKITIEYYDQAGAASFQFKVQGAVPQQIVPNSWLSPSVQVLPDGWNLGIDADGNVNYDHIKINQSSVVLTDSTGSTHEYAWTGSGYKPPVNEDGQLVRNADGTHTLQDVDGRTYIFNADGTLQSLTSPIDDRKPAALKYEYEGTPARLKQVTDGVDANRWVKVYYYGSSECGSIPSGFDNNTTQLAGLLCAVKTDDGRATYFYYVERQLARIAKPGNELTDYQYEAVQNAGVTIGYRLVGIRDHMANDAIAAGVRASDNAVKTQISYNSLGRAISVTQPAATPGANRIQHTIEYLPGIKSYVDQNGNTIPGYEGKTNQHVVGATEPHGFSRQIKYDNLFRTIESTDIANLTAKIEWDLAKDLVLSTTDPTGLKSTTVYDDNDQPIDSYGPAPAAWFGIDRKPASTYLAQVPRSEARYDENIIGPAVSWYDYTKQSGNANGVLSGAPKLHTTGINTSTPGVLGYDFTSPPITAGAGAQGIGFSATGKLRLPPGGVYILSVNTSDGVRIWVDDKLVLDKWLDSASRTESAAFSVSDTTPKRFRVDVYRRTASTGSFDIAIRQNGGFNFTNNWGSWLKPGYGLATSSKTYDNTIGDVTATTNYGANPELSLPQNTTVDPTGLNLTTNLTYEAQGANGSFLRQTSKTLPGGNTTSYNYYTAVDTRDNPCTVGTTESFKQAGFMRRKTEPNPDGSAGGGGGGSSGAPAVRSSSSGSINTGVLTLTKPTGTVDGDLLIMTASADLSAAEDLTYSVPSGWTQLLVNTRSDAASAGNNLQVWYKIANSEPASYAITPDHANLMGGSILRVDGHNPDNPVNVSNVTASLTGEASAPAVTTTVNNAQVLRLVTWDQSKSMVAMPSGHTQSYYVNAEGHDNWGGYKEQATAGTTGVAQFDLSSGAPYVGFTVAIAPSGSGGGSSSATGRATETIYDAAGRTVASRYNNDSWTCTTYDPRGRVTQTVVPTINGRTGRSLTTNYSYQGSPLKVQVVDSVAGTTLSEIDLLGRTVSATDTFGSVSTATYDSLGRLSSKTTPVGTEGYTYDTYGRVTEYRHNGTKYTTITYDAFSRVQDITYDQAQGTSTPPSGSAPVVRSQTSGSTSTGSLTLDKPSGTVDGDLLIMTASADLSASETVTYTIPSGWTSLLPLTRSDASSAGNNLQVWYKIASSEPASYAVVPDHSNLMGGSITRIDGHSPTNPIDVSNVIASLTGEASAPSVTTMADNDLVLRLVTWDQSKSMVAMPLGYTQHYYINAEGHDNWGGHKTQSTAGSTGVAQFDLSAGSPYVGFTVAIRSAGGGGGNPPSGDKLKLEQIKRDALQRSSGAVFRFSNGATFDETVTRTQSGMVSSYTDAFGGNSAGGAYSYDKAGRLTGATVDGTSYTYGYGAPTGCSGTYNPNANKNSNRTSFSVNATTKAYCYDHADRLISSTDTQLGTPTYDDHGNTISLAGNGTPITFTYDAADSNTAIEQGANKVTYLKTASGSVLRKKEYTSGSLTKSYRYLAGGAVLQTCNLTNDNDCATTDTYLGLPGGVTLTLPGSGGTTPPPASSPPPSPWLPANIGGHNGTSSVNNNTFTLTSNAYDIWDDDDQSHVLTQALNGNGEIVARVVSQTNTNEWAKAGLIIKDAHAESSNYAAVMVTPENGLRMQYNYTNDIDGGSYSFPSIWLKLVRNGNTITTYKSTNGTAWTQIGSQSVSLPNTAQIGLFTLSGDTSQTTTAVFDTVTITRAIGSSLPAGWANADIGNPAITGNASYTGSTYTLSGAGEDAWGDDDQFHYAYRTLKGNGEIVARVTTQTNTNEWAKAGVVVKASPTAEADYASIHITPDHNIRMENSFNTSVDGGSYALPNTWLKLTRSGNTITTYRSSNGTTWTQVGSATISLPATITLGLYVSSVNASALSTATFDNVAVTGTSQPLPPGGLTGATYSLKNFHGDTAITVNQHGIPTSSVYLYEPFGQPTSSTTFGTNSNPTNATDQSMGWAASPTRKVAGAFSVPIIQMGARVYLPSAGRFLQVDPIEGGAPNSYVYPGDPVSFNDYSGKATCSQLIGAICGVLFKNVKGHVTPQGPLSLPVAVSRQTTRPKATPKPAAKPSGVFTIGIGGSVGFGLFVSGSVGVAIGRGMSIGVYTSYGGGGTTGLKTSIGLQAGYESGRSVSSIRETEVFGGASAGLVYGGGVDFTDDGFSAEAGLGLSGGPPVIPFEGHIGSQRTHVHQFR